MSGLVFERRKKIDISVKFFFKSMSTVIHHLKHVRICVVGNINSRDRQSCPQKKNIAQFGH